MLTVEAVLKALIGWSAFFQTLKDEVGILHEYFLRQKTIRNEITEAQVAENISQNFSYIFIDYNIKIIEVKFIFQKEIIQEPNRRTVSLGMYLNSAQTYYVGIQQKGQLNSYMCYY